MAGNHILKNLSLLIRNATLKYNGEYVWQDVELTEDFKEYYKIYLERNGYSIEYFDTTAVITTSSSKYIFVPNQWFVIASYPVSVLHELLLYKDYFKSVCDYLGKKPDQYAKQLRDASTLVDKSAFCDAARFVIRHKNHSAEESQIDEAVERLWRFVSDYSWWSGQKTIDRGDFFLSVILNMLNLVNVSQGYVADIVNAYVSDYKLGQIVRSVDGFTKNMTCNIVDRNISKIDLYEEDHDKQTAAIIEHAEKQYNESAITGRVRLKITSVNNNREIRCKK